MKIFRDINTGDELFCDVYPYGETEDGFFYRVEGKMATDTTQVSDDMFGGNKSAEGGGDEDADDASSKSGINVVIRHNLVETGYEKKTFKVYIKDYMKHTLKKLKENEMDEANITAWKEAAMAAIAKFILPNFDDFAFYIHESMDEHGLTVLLRWEHPKDKPEADEIPVLYFIKECVIGEKV